MQLNLDMLQIHLMLFLTPNSSPATIASSHGIPINQAIGANKYPSIISIDKSKPKLRCYKS